MKKTLLLFSAMICATAIRCGSDDLLTNAGKDDNFTPSKDVFQVPNDEYDLFFIDYGSFIASLSEDQLLLVTDLIAKLELRRFNARSQRSEAVTCNCGEGENSCSASAAFSECCICWNPLTHNGACGTYFGIASCKIERKEELRAEEAKHLVNFKARDFLDYLRVVKSKGVGIGSILASYRKLEQFAI